MRARLRELRRWARLVRARREYVVERWSAEGQLLSTGRYQMGDPNVDFNVVLHALMRNSMQVFAQRGGRVACRARTALR